MTKRPVAKPQREAVAFIIDTINGTLSRDQTGTAEQAQEIEEVEPDAWDLAMIREAEEENDGEGIPIEDFARELGIEL